MTMETFEPDGSRDREPALSPAEETETVEGAEEAEAERNPQPADDPALSNPEP